MASRPMHSPCTAGQQRFPNSVRCPISVTLLLARWTFPVPNGNVQRASNKVTEIGQRTEFGKRCCPAVQGECIGLDAIVTSKTKRREKSRTGNRHILFGHF